MVKKSLEKKTIDPSVFPSHQELRKLIPSWEKIICSYGLILCFLCLISPMRSQAAIIFKSGFEDGVSLSTPFQSGGKWWQKISGADQGYNWVSDLPGAGNGIIQFMVETQDVPLEELNQYIRSEIQTVIGPDGRSTRAWFMLNVGHYTNGPPYYTGQRVCLSASAGNEPPDDFNEFFTTYHMKLNPDFATSMIKNSWYLTVEIWVPDNTNKLFIIRHSTGGALKWLFEPHTDIPLINESAVVPLNQWFKVGIYYKHRTSSDGIIQIWINDDKIFDYKGSTASSGGGVNALNFLKAYSNRANVGHWVDDFIMYDTLPTSPALDPPPNLSIQLKD